MVLILCEEVDFAAAWAAERLRERGVEVEFVTGADLAAAGRLEHRVGADGITFELELADGRRLSRARVHGVLNRLSFLPAACVRRIGGPDRDYALQEYYALYLSWLHALAGPKLNAPTPQGLCGNWRHPASWAALAMQADLPAEPYRQSSRDDPMAVWQPGAGSAPAAAFVVGERVIAEPPVQEFDGPCRKLAAAAGATLLGIDFAPGADGHWRFIGATVLPDLVRGGPPLADALAQVFRP